MIQRFLSVLFVAVLLAGCAAQMPADSGLSLSDKPLPGKFIWHDLITDDVEVAQGFYGGLFGWRFEDTVGPGGNDYTLIRGRDGRLVGGMVQVAEPANKDFSRWLNYLSVADVDAAVRAVIAAGGKELVASRDLGSIARAAVVEDAQGAVLGLITSRVGDPDDTMAALPGFVSWTELLTTNAGDAAEFYASVVGYRVEALQRYGGQYLMLNAQGRQRAGVQTLPSDDAKPLWLSHFGVTDLEGAVQRAASLGGELLIVPSDDVRNGTMALLVGPTGAVFGLQDINQRGEG